ncbi:putative Ig domain-containing protein [Chitinophaga alhagiae]|uniref:putative Ig domain-containing protein n=1 Tax=Chitinophaga alhagiae TaxID=2203219 RepID=UPI0018E50570|nr:putative Ig domain-containing protein [Chitinophaga alhagiae]
MKIFFLYLITFILYNTALLAQRPIISYNGPQIYMVNNAITPLTPVNAGGPMPSSEYGRVTTIAGSGDAGSTDSSAMLASFNSPVDLAKDSLGNIYVADFLNHRIRRITTAGVVTTFAGSDSGYVDGTGISAKFARPQGIAVDAAGNVYVADRMNHVIRKITPSGVVSTFAGSGMAGSADGVGTAASFREPAGVAIDTAGNLYVSDMKNHTVRKITPAQVVSTLAGVVGVLGFADGNGSSAKFNYPFGVAVDMSGNIYVADRYNHRIRKVTSGGVVSTVAGNGFVSSVDGAAALAGFNNPVGVAVDEAGSIYVGDYGNHKIRKILPGGIVVTLGGCTCACPEQTDSVGNKSTFNNPFGVEVDASGSVYVAEFTGNLIRNVSNTGYLISPSLPRGLSFDGATGIISGTPLAVSGVTSYIVTAYNNAGSDSDTFSIEVRSDAPPQISYNTSQAYYTDKEMPFQVPVNSGGPVPAVAAYGQVSTFAGSGVAGSANGTGIEATFSGPYGVAMDKTGNIYVADRNNHLIRKVTPSGVVSTFAGSGTAGSADGVGTAAGFREPAGIAIDTAGNLYVSDMKNHTIRKITPAGVVSTLAGTVGILGFADGSGSAAKFNYPFGLATDVSGNIYVADRYNHKIRKITPAGVVTTLAGSVSGYLDSVNPLSAKFNNPVGIAIDQAGAIYVGDYSNNRIRKIALTGEVSTLAGQTASGSTDGTGAAASFANPFGISADDLGNIYVADYNNHKIRKVTSTGVVSTLAGSGSMGSADTVGSSAEFKYPVDVTADGKGRIYVVDGNHKVRKVSVTGYSISPSLPAGLVFEGATGTISGTPTVVSGSTSYVVTAYNNVGFDSDTFSIELYSDAPPQISYSTPQTYYTSIETSFQIPVNSGGPVPAVAAYGQVSTFAGSGVAGSANGLEIEATFNGPHGVAMDKTGNIYVADRNNHLIRKVTPSGVVSTFAGSGTAGSADGIGTAAGFREPAGIAIDTAGNLYVSDMKNHTIRKITPAGVVSTLAGTVGILGFADGSGSAAKFNYPFGLATDVSGNIYVADRYNHKIRKITPAGVVTTLAGSVSGYLDSVNPLSAKFNNPVGIAIDQAGAIYVGDYSNNRIRKIALTGEVSTLAGQTASGSTDGTGAAASFANPFGISADDLGNIYVADYNNHKIRKVTSTGVVSTLAGSGSMGSADTVGSSAEFKYPVDVTADGKGRIYVVDGNHKVRKVSVTGYSISPSLPAGLVFEGATGTISGTPTVVSGSASYVVTAYNNVGFDSDTISIEVVDDSHLLMSAGLLEKIAALNTNLNSKGDTILQQAWTVYPNPNNGRFTIEMTLSSPDPQLLKIYNTVGVLVYSKVLTVVKGRMEINVSNQLTPGIYLVVIERMGARKIIVH